MLVLERWYRLEPWQKVQIILLFLIPTRKKSNLYGHLKENIKAKRKGGKIEEQRRTKKEENNFSLVVVNHSMWKTKFYRYLSWINFVKNLFTHKIFSNLLLVSFFGLIKKREYSLEARNIELVKIFVPITTRTKFSIWYIGSEAWDKTFSSSKQSFD